MDDASKVRKGAEVRNAQREDILYPCIPFTENIRFGFPSLLILRGQSIMVLENDTEAPHDANVHGMMLRIQGTWMRYGDAL